MGSGSQSHAPVTLIPKTANETDIIRERIGSRVDLEALEKRKTPFLHLEIEPILY
jgi:riboflavin synthase alpha subunit